jgi:ubiquinone/menaquinone biosynthesis C-methylase UbiE
VTVIGIKAEHRAMWAMGNYFTVATDLIGELGAALVAACGVQAGELVLDVAAGCGNAAVPAAAAGARVVASDLSPELLAVGRSRAEELLWVAGDAEGLPFRDGVFDVAMSCVGAMFAPDHQATARELVRVCRRGGRIGLVTWAPEGFLGRLSQVTAAHAPPLPPNAQSPQLWGSPEHVAALFGDRVSSLQMHPLPLRVDRFTGPLHYREYMKAHYGPMIALYRSQGADSARMAALDRDLLQFLTSWFRTEATADSVFTCEYVLVTARTR